MPPKPIRDSVEADVIQNALLPYTQQPHSRILGAVVTVAMYGSLPDPMHDKWPVQVPAPFDFRGNGNLIKHTGKWGENKYELLPDGQALLDSFKAFVAAIP